MLAETNHSGFPLPIDAFPSVASEKKKDARDFPSVSCLCNSHFRGVEALAAAVIYAGRLLYCVSLFYERGCDASGRADMSD